MTKDDIRPTCAAHRLNVTVLRSNIIVIVVPRSFHNIKHIERSPIRISLFYYDTIRYVLTASQPQTVHQHRSTEITELAAIFGGMSTLVT